jgi:hypothetical protein
MCLRTRGTKKTTAIIFVDLTVKMCSFTVFILALDMQAFSMRRCFSNIARAVSTREISFHCDSLLMLIWQLSADTV